MSCSFEPWRVEDAEWYASVAANDELIQRFTTESPTVTAEAVRTAIVELLAGPVGAAGFLVADATTGERLGNIALTHDGREGDVSYWLAPSARGQGVATRALHMLSRWAFTKFRSERVASVGAHRQRRLPRGRRAGRLHARPGPGRAQADQRRDLAMVAYVLHRDSPCHRVGARDNALYVTWLIGFFGYSTLVRWASRPARYVEGTATPRPSC